MKKLFLISTAVLALTVAHGQTNVSGGIFSNTTWTKVNSPYIVTDTVVVFPGITLTIQPGVTVKFDSLIQLEVRQARLIANGTSVDSITFTSNCVIPAPGKYSGIFINGGSMTSQFKYCNVMYSQSGIQNLSSGNGFYFKNGKILFNISGAWGGGLGNNSILDSCIVKYNTGVAVGGFDVMHNCILSKNYQGVQDGFTLINCLVDSNTTKGIRMNTGSVLNCTIRYNGIGIYWGNPVTINNCIITYNQTGIEPATNQTITNCVIDSNLIGIDNGSQYNSQNNNINNCQIRYNGTGIFDNPYANSIITQNYIEYNGIGIDLKKPDNIYCNKICYSTSYDLKYSSNINTNCVANNYWCTPDSASTQAVIYDAHDNVSVGLVNYMPIDSTCYLATSINEIENISFAIYPNPFSSQTTFHTDNLLHNATLTVDNYFGQTVKEIKNINGQTVVFSRDNLASGLYFVRLTEENKTIAVEKLVITDK